MLKLHFVVLLGLVFFFALKQVGFVETLEPGIPMRYLHSINQPAVPRNKWLRKDDFWLLFPSKGVRYKLHCLQREYSN